MGATLDGLNYAWWFCDLPGYRPHPSGSPRTYSPFDYNELPAIEQTLDDQLAWLAEQPVAEQHSIAEAVRPMRAATSANLVELISGTGITVPHTFEALITGVDLQRRVRSRTDCYLDLGNFVFTAPDGGKLIHFLSDSQWVLHWLVYSDGATEAVIATPQPLGFDLGDQTARVFDPEQAVICACSFSEFLYRFWFENELCWALAAEHGPLTVEQQRYLAHYNR